ncbi:MAG TPA: hypothetical protein GX501_09535 [Clostridiaceae bacterium]|nr:hypothetical protein [Clostridiaceae bacterium]
MGKDMSQGKDAAFYEETVFTPEAPKNDDPMPAPVSKTEQAHVPGYSGTPDPLPTIGPENEPVKTSEPVGKTMPENTSASSPVPEPVPSHTPMPSPAPSPTRTAAPSPTPQSQQLQGIVNPYVPYTYDQMIIDCQELAETYPEIISLDVAGQSVEGRDLVLVKLGKGEKKIILCGSHHAREYITSSYLMKMAEEYAKAYHDTGSYGNYNVKDILDRACIYIVPMVNPDGVNLVVNGPDHVGDKEAVAAMAMLRKSYREWKANINGVDLNRQYPAEWEKKYDEIGRPASESYKGEAPSTEPEVKAMMELSCANDFILAASFHSKGNVIYWADRGTVDLIPGVKDMAKRLSKLTRYSLMPVSEDPSVYGAGYENWFRLEFLRPAFCIELTPYNNTDVPHDDRKFDKLVWNNAKYIGLFLADEALKR